MVTSDFRDFNHEKLRQELARIEGFDPTPVIKSDSKLFLVLIITTVVSFLVTIFTEVNVTLVVALGGFIAFVLRYAHVKHKLASRLKKSFASSSGLSYVDSVKTTTHKEDGVMYGVGHSHKLKELLEGSFHNKEASYFIYSYTTGQGKQQHENTLRVFTVRLRNNLPYILLDNTSNDLGFLSNLPVWPSEAMRASLEGNFDSHFKMYSKTPNSSDPLSIITPDVMQDLIEHKDNFDIEISNGQLTIFSSSEGEFVPMLQRMMYVAEKVVLSLEGNIKHYSVPVAASGMQLADVTLKRSWLQYAFYIGILVPMSILVITGLVSESFVTSDNIMPFLFIIGGMTVVVLLIKNKRR